MISLHMLISMNGLGFRLSRLVLINWFIIYMAVDVVDMVIDMIIISLIKYVIIICVIIVCVIIIYILGMIIDVLALLRLIERIHISDLELIGMIKDLLIKNN